MTTPRIASSKLGTRLFTSELPYNQRVPASLILQLVCLSLIVTWSFFDPPRTPLFLPHWQESVFAKRLHIHAGLAKSRQDSLHGVYSLQELTNMETRVCPLFFVASSLASMWSIFLCHPRM